MEEKLQTDGSLIDSEIRELVLSRLEVMSPDTIKSIGGEGIFSKGELIEHVRAGDKIGRVIEQVEIEWIRAMKDGIITHLTEAV